MKLTNEEISLFGTIVATLLSWPAVIIALAFVLKPKAKPKLNTYALDQQRCAPNPLRGLLGGYPK